MSGKPQQLGGTAIKPVGWDRTGWEAFQYMIYNPDTGEILTRTPLSWAKITAFYIVYYSFLTAFWLGCMNIFFLTIPEGHPRWMLDESIIGTNPGVGIRPSSTDKRIDSAMFQLKAADSDNITTDANGEGDKNVDYAMRAFKYLELYKNTTDLDFNCTKNEIYDGDENGCVFDLAVLQECANWPYGYVIDENATALGESRYAEPCIFLKLNKIFNWKPTPLKAAKGKNMAETLKDKKYDMMTPKLKETIVKSADKNFVWIDCFGRYPADKDVFKIEYFPQNQGIPIKYFPYKGGNYHAPLLAIKFKENQASWGQLQHIECRTWFEGVKHETKDKIGLKQFEVHILPASTKTKLP